MYFFHRGVVSRGDAGGGVPIFLTCLYNLTTDHTSLSRRSFLLGWGDIEEDESSTMSDFFFWCMWYTHLLSSDATHFKFRRKRKNLYANWYQVPLEPTNFARFFGDKTLGISMG